MVAVRIGNNDIVIISIELLPTISPIRLALALLIDVISIAGKISAVGINGISILMKRLLVDILPY